MSWYPGATAALAGATAALTGATAAGLVAAIPAVIFYNYLSDKIRMFTSDLDDFSHDFIYLIEKNFSKDTSSFQVHDMDLT